MVSPAQDAVSPGELVIAPSTHECLGFEWDVTGDDNRNAGVEVAWRPAAGGEWRAGHPLLRIKGELTGSDKPEEGHRCGNLFAGSLVDLEAGREYEVKLTMQDADGGGAEKVVRARTRPEPAPPKPTRTLHLYPVDFAGAKQEPAFSDFRDAYAEAKPGERILVHAGIHRPSKPHEAGQVDFLLDKAATADKPLVIVGAGDGEAVMNGAGNCLFRLKGADHHHFEGLTFRDADHLVQVERGDACRGLVVRGCRFEESSGPLWLMSGKCREASILDNVFVGPAKEWTPRDECQKKYGASHAIWIAGQGHAVSWNRFSGWWDAIDFFNVNPKGPRGERNGAVDFSHNEISECIDDAIEMDYGVHNVRVSRNFIHNCFMGISAQPLHGGPGYVFRNVVFNVLRQGLKLNVFPAGLVIYHNTFLVPDGFRNSPIWQNSRLRNNLWLGCDGGGDGYLWTGTLTLETSSMDHNGYRTTGFTRERPIWWRFPEPRKVPTSSRPSHEGTYRNLAEFHAATGYEEHAVEVDYDVFVKGEPMSGKPVPLPELDLRLKEGSAAVDAGERLPNFNDGFRGKAPDLGAYEAGDAPMSFGPRKQRGSAP
jgi:hypothetical protein